MLLQGAPQGLVLELPGMGAGPPGMHFEGPPPSIRPMLQEPMQELFQQMTRMREAMPPRPSPMMNPCLNDLRRLRCNPMEASACLKKSADSLAPECASFLLSPRPVPVPQPQPMMILAPSPAPLPRPMRGPAGSGFFELLEEEEDGSLHRVFGNLPSMRAPAGGVMMPPRPPFLDGLPPEVGSLLNRLLPAGLEAVLSRMEREVDEAERAIDDDEGAHPCAREIAMCQAEMRTSDGGAIQACLSAHRSQLSPHCGCFLEQLKQRQAALEPPPRPPAAILHESHERRVVEPPHPPHTRGPTHTLACFLFLTSLFFLTFMVLRSLLAACFGRKRFAVLVPPESASIKTVGGGKVAMPAPLSAAELKVVAVAAKK